MPRKCSSVDVRSLEPRRLLSLAPAGPEVVVPFPASDTGFHRFDVAVAGDGSYLVAGTVPDGGEDARLLAVRYSPAGVQVGDVLTLDSDVSSGTEVSADVDADGDAVVAYTGAGAADAGADVSIVRISAAGVASTPQQVATKSASAGALLADPQVSMDAGGGFFLGWIQSRNVQFTSDWIDAVRVRAFDARGDPRAAEMVVTELRNPTTYLGELDVAAQPDGSGAVVACDVLGDTLGHLQVGRVSVTEVLDSESLTGPAQLGWPEVAALTDGSFVVAYERTPQGQHEPRALVQRYDAAGDVLGEPIEVGDGIAAGGDLTGRIAVEAMPDGGFAAAFAHERDDGVATLYVRRFLAGGAPDTNGAVAVGPAAPLDSPASQFAPPALGASADGDGVVVHRVTNESPLSFRRLAADLADVALIGDGVLQVRGTAGADRIGIASRGGGGGDVIVTHNAETRLFHAPDVDAIFVDALGGDDTVVNDTALAQTLHGGAGSDKIAGGSGADSLSGGDGKDKLLGRDGRDSLSGNAGNDTCEGGAGADRVAGNGGRDRLYGGSGNDRLHGGAQGDRLYGQGGNDQLFGEGGHDRLYGDDDATGRDTLTGGAGNDVLISRNDSAIDHLFGGRGHDSCIADDDDVLSGIEAV